MPNSMIERVAKAIYEAHALPGWQAGWAHEDVRVCDDYRAYARAAIEATREPTEAMLAAGMMHEATDLASEYRAMIDAALKGPTK